MERLTRSSEYSSLTMEVTGRTSRENDISNKDSERTNVIINCDPCENEGDEQPAEGFCENCQEYLCSSCFKIHRRPALWRHHVLLDKENMPSSKTTKEQLNYECTEPCSEHSTKVLEYFCQTHSQLGCPVCITTKQRMCNDVDYIPDIAGHFRESTEVKETYETLQSLKEDINTYSATVSKDKMKVKTYEKNAKEHILQLRDEFDSICNRLVDNVEHVSKCDESNIEDSLKTCEEILNKIQLRQSVLEKKQAEMKVSQLFTEAKLSELSAKEYRRELETTKECTKSRHYEIKFDIEALREMIKLTFRDQQNENDPSCAKVSREYPQKNTIKQGHIHDLDSKADNKEENEEEKSQDVWTHSISPVNWKVYNKEENVEKRSTITKDALGPSKSKPIWKGNEKMNKEVDYNQKEDASDISKPGKVNWKVYSKEENVDKISAITEDTWGQTKSKKVNWKVYNKEENVDKISTITEDTWCPSKSKPNWKGNEKMYKEVDYKESEDKRDFSKPELNWKGNEKMYKEVDYNQKEDAIDISKPWKPQQEVNPRKTKCGRKK